MKVEVMGRCCSHSWEEESEETWILILVQHGCETEYVLFNTISQGIVDAWKVKDS